MCNLCEDDNDFRDQEWQTEVRISLKKAYNNIRKKIGRREKVEKKKRESNLKTVGIHWLFWPRAMGDPHTQTQHTRKHSTTTYVHRSCSHTHTHPHARTSNHTNMNIWTHMQKVHSLYQNKSHTHTLTHKRLFITHFKTAISLKEKNYSLCYLCLLTLVPLSLPILL